MKKEDKEKFEAEFQRLKKLHPDKNIEYANGEFFIRAENGAKCFFYYPGSMEFHYSKDYNPTPENFQPVKNWLDIRLRFGAITKEEYDKELNELKEKYGIKE